LRAVGDVGGVFRRFPVEHDHELAVAAGRDKKVRKNHRVRARTEISSRRTYNANLRIRNKGEHVRESHQQHVKFKASFIHFVSLLYPDCSVLIKFIASEGGGVFPVQIIYIRTSNV